jgi:hypothetical protein
MSMPMVVFFATGAVGAVVAVARLALGWAVDFS